MKNSYLSFASWVSEDILYSAKIGFSKDLVDCLSCTHDEFCYECVSVHSSNKVFFSENCSSCIESWFLYDCSGCTNCFGCTNLRNKSYCIYNQQYTREDYLKKLELFSLSSYRSIFDLIKKNESYEVKCYSSFRKYEANF